MNSSLLKALRILMSYIHENQWLENVSVKKTALVTTYWFKFTGHCKATETIQMFSMSQSYLFIDGVNDLWMTASFSSEFSLRIPLNILVFLSKNENV